MIYLITRPASGHVQPREAMRLVAYSFYPDQPTTVGFVQVSSSCASFPSIVPTVGNPPCKHACQRIVVQQLLQPCLSEYDFHRLPAGIIVLLSCRGMDGAPKLK